MTKGHTALGRNEEGRKWCPRCQVWKFESEFGKLRREPDGLCRWCKTCINNKQRKDYQENREMRAKRQRRWYASNKDKYKSYVKNMEANHPGSIALYHRNTHAKRKHLKVSLSIEELANRWKVQQGLCEYCQSELIKTKDGTNPCQAQLDHVWPVSKGGSHTIDNIVWACRRCNTSKSNLSLEEWRSRNGS